jgi:predicted porin
LLYLGVSFADATLYGNIDQTYNSTKTTLGANITNQKTGISAYQMGQSYLGVRGAEELGDGIKASYLYEFGLATETTAAPTNRQSYVGLSGGFGALRIGKQYSQAFNNTVAVDPGGATGGRGALYLYTMVSYDGATNAVDEVTAGEHPLRQDKGFQYDLPNFMPGLKLGITKVFGNENSANNGAKKGDGTGFNASYSAGGLYAGFTTDSAKGQGILENATPTIFAAPATATNKLTTLALSYDLGMAKPSYQSTKVSVSTATWKTDMFALSVPLGAATVFISTSTGKLDLAGTTGDRKLKGMQYGVNYGLSKRTVAYWHAGNDTQTFSTGTTSKTTGFGIGVHHSF